MSDNDLIKRGDVRAMAMLIFNSSFLTIDIVGQLVDNLHADEQPMSAVEYENVLWRMEHTQPMPEELYLNGKFINYGEIEKAVAIVEKWAREHPEERSEE